MRQTAPRSGSIYQSQYVWSGPEREPWMDEALYAQTDPESFFPEKGGSTRDAKRICESCDVRLQCLEYAMRKDERFGIWGGTSERERRKLKSQPIGEVAK